MHPQPHKTGGKAKHEAASEIDEEEMHKRCHGSRTGHRSNCSAEAVSRDPFPVRFRNWRNFPQGLPCEVRRPQLRTFTMKIAAPGEARPHLRAAAYPASHNHEQRKSHPPKERCCRYRGPVIAGQVSRGDRSPNWRGTNAALRSNAAG